jgi:hypothetical protein
MTVRLADLTPADIAAERERLPRAFSPDPAERARSWLFWGCATALTLYCLYRFDFLSMNFLHGLSKFAQDGRICRCSRKSWARPSPWRSSAPCWAQCWRSR